MHPAAIVVLRGDRYRPNNRTQEITVVSDVEHISFVCVERAPRRFTRSDTDREVLEKQALPGFRVSREKEKARRDDISDNHADRRKFAVHEFVCPLGMALGFREIGGRGSHRVFARTGLRELVNLQVEKGQAKPYQVRQIATLIRRYDLHLEDAT